MAISWRRSGVYPILPRLTICDLELETRFRRQPEQLLSRGRLPQPIPMIPGVTTQVIAAVQNLPEGHAPELGDCEECRRLHLDGQTTLGLTPRHFPWSLTVESI